MTAYYNEIDPYAAQWLRNLITQNLIAPGVVDERPIQDVRPADLDGFTQHHFFAGIGGWSCALRLAAWPDDRKVWTGSCPCQPFSQAGKRRGFADERHLWPFWRYLIAVCRPATIFGEQVARAPDWLRLVRRDLEAMDYAVGCCPVEAASAGADQLRDRYWFVAERAEQSERESQHADGAVAWDFARADAGGVVRLDYAWVLGADGKARRVEPGIRLLAHDVPARVAKLRALGNAIVPSCAVQFIAAYMDCHPAKYPLRSRARDGIL